MRGGGKELLLALKRKGYRLVFARVGVLSDEDLSLARELGIRVLLKDAKPGADLLELEYGPRAADVYTMPRVKRLGRLKIGRVAMEIDLKAFYGDLSGLRRFIRANPRGRFFFTVGPSNAAEVKDPRDLVAFLTEVLGMEERKAMESVVSSPW